MSQVWPFTVVASRATHGGESEKSAPPARPFLGLSLLAVYPNKTGDLRLVEHHVKWMYVPAGYPPSTPRRVGERIPRFREVDSQPDSQQESFSFPGVVLWTAQVAQVARKSRHRTAWTRVLGIVISRITLRQAQAAFARFLDDTDSPNWTE